MSGITRRDFGRVATIGVVGSAAGGCTPRQSIAKASELVIGVAQAFEYPAGHPAFVVRLEGPAEHGVGAGADLVAFHLACPHMGCPLGTSDATAMKAGRLGPCACHQSLFDMRFSGRQIYGRATQNLVRVLLEVEANEVFAVGIEGTPFGEPPVVEG